MIKLTPDLRWGKNDKTDPLLAKPGLELAKELIRLIQRSHIFLYTLKRIKTEYISKRIKTE